jgi:hypothetical protein
MSPGTFLFFFGKLSSKIVINSFLPDWRRAWRQAEIDINPYEQLRVYSRMVGTYQELEDENNLWRRSFKFKIRVLQKLVPPFATNKYVNIETGYSIRFYGAQKKGDVRMVYRNLPENKIERLELVMQDNGLSITARQNSNPPLNGSW